MKNMLGKLGGFILLAGIVFGLFVIIFVPIEMYMKAEAEKWPSRKAVVTMSYPRHMAGSGAGRHASGPFWKAEVCGKFLDNDEKFCAARIRYGGFRLGANRAGAAATVADYPVGREIDVYYSPQDPRETVLEARSSWREMYILLGLGIGFLLVPLFLWIFRKRIEPERYGDE